MFNKIFLTSCVLIGLTACATDNSNIKKLPSFDDHNHASYALSGNSTVTGISSYTDKAGHKHDCSNQNVYLIPDTHFYREVLNADFNKMTLESSLNNAQSSLIRTTQCDNDGWFKFENLPEGKWVALSIINWHHNGEEYATVGKNKKSTYVLPHQVVMYKDLVSRNGYDQIHIKEGDFKFFVSKNKANMKLEHLKKSDIRNEGKKIKDINGGECNEAKLGKEDVLPKWCVYKKLNK